jgi:hypothetical protein
MLAGLAHRPASEWHRASWKGELWLAIHASKGAVRVRWFRISGLVFGLWLGVSVGYIEGRALKGVKGPDMFGLLRKQIFDSFRIPFFRSKISCYLPYVEV